MRNRSVFPFILLSSLARVATAAGVVTSTNNARIPVGLSKVISDLDTEQGCSDVSAATFIPSRTVTRQKKSAILQSLVGSTEETSANVIGTDSGLVLTQPKSTDEVTASASACGGTVLFVPDSVDLSRGEGLFDDLAPAMEAILASGSKGTALIVLVPNGDVEATRMRLEKCAEGILYTIITPTPVSVLEDVFAQVLYVSSPDEAVNTVKSCNQVSAVDAIDRVTDVVSAASTPLSLKTDLSAADLAAARKMGPAARVCLAEAIEQVQSVCQDADGTAKLVVNFGELCDAAIQRALDDWGDSAGESPSILHSSIAGQIKSNLRSNLDTDLHVLFEEQVEQLGLASFEDFKKGLSKLLVSPNLASDMEEQANKALAAFASAARKLLSKKCSSWSIQPAKDQFRRKVKEHVKNRLLAARASGQYRPLPRKGVTVGLHWLLPKPFGNDFRQEPWMVHATDNMVYIPKDKITDVSPEEVAAGDWRTKVVPSPVGNDMLYLQ